MPAISFDGLLVVSAIALAAPLLTATVPGLRRIPAVVVEILAGLVVAFAPRIGGWLVAAWLWAITLNLLAMPGYADVALRDAGLSLAALALARLATQYQDAIDPPRER